MNPDTAMKLIAMVESCAIWAAIFVVFYFVTRAVGMTNNLPKETKKRLEILKKFTDSFIDKVTDDKQDTEKSMIKAFRTLKKYQRIVIKIFSVYSYEHPLNVESNNTEAILNKMHLEFQKISVCISRKDYSEIEKPLNKIVSLIAEADKQLDKVIVIDEEEKILHG